MGENNQKTSLESGAQIIRALAKNLPDSPGVYRMVDKRGDVLYVGKARSLRKRVMSYTNAGKLSVRMQRMVALTADMVFIHTPTEVEALLLEGNLIKKLKPRFNILLRDDKSFPYILITGDHDFPLLLKHRGAQKRKGDYFGPFASGLAVNRTLIALQKAFMLRNCSDSVFDQRKRPCLQYHIKRCTAPCVDMVSREDYRQQVEDAKMFLSGKSKAIQERLAAQMQEASAAQDYEVAARLRDRIAALTSIQAQQDIFVSGLGDVDVICLHQEAGRSCVQVFFFRAGQNLGNRAYFPRHDQEESAEDILMAFIAQFYDNKPVPREVLVNYKLPQGQRELLEEALGSRPGQARKVSLFYPQRGGKRRIVDIAADNARKALELEVIRRSTEETFLKDLAGLLDMDESPRRIEVFDNSHIAGTNMVGAMIVAGPEGFKKNAYRKFNIRQADASDDYGMMREVLRRRFSRALKEGKEPGAEDWPDLLIIDGGKGQLGASTAVLDDLGIRDKLEVLAIAKGPDRNAGRERFFMEGRDEFGLPVDSPVLHYLQRLRDEAHRFAIGAHRTRRTNQISRSLLDEVPGIGAARKKALLHYFGSAQAVARAGVKDLEQVDGISTAMARSIHDFFHET